MIFSHMRAETNIKRRRPPLQCLQFVDSRNRTHYLFRAIGTGSTSSDKPFVDLRQLQGGHRLTVQGMIIRSALKKGNG